MICGGAGLAKDDQEEAFERGLTATLSRAVEFLKFAETKNAALLTFASAWLIAGINFLSGSNSENSPWRIAFSLAMCFFAASAATAIYSFLPRLDLGAHHRDPERKKSLLYFGDISTFEPTSYKDRVNERYRPPADHTATQSYLDDLAVQVVVVSQIAARKFRIFNVSACLVGLGLVVLAVPAATYLGGLALLGGGYTK